MCLTLFALVSFEKD